MTHSYREYPLEPPLDAFVECVWILRTPRPPSGAAPERIAPDGCVEVVVQLESRARAGGAGGPLHRQPGAFVLGPQGTPLLLEPEGPMATLGIRFRPGGAALFLPFPVDRLGGTEIAIDLAFGRAGAELVDRIGASPSDARRVAVVDAFLHARLSAAGEGSGRAGPIAAAVARMLCGRASISALARESGWSVRQLERRFRAETGLAPRLLGRIIRFQRVLRAVSGRETGWVSIAIDCGYADQPHLIRDFREFTGSAPAQFLRSDPGVGRVFISARRLDRFFGGAGAISRVSHSFKTAGAPPN